MRTLVALIVALTLTLPVYDDGGSYAIPTSGAPVYDDGGSYAVPTSDTDRQSVWE